MTKDKQLITADTISSTLSFTSKLETYETNVEKLSDINAKIEKAKRGLVELEEQGSAKRGTEDNAYYGQETVNSLNLQKQELESTGTRADQLYVYVPKERDKDKDKLYNSFGHLASVSRDTVAMDTLEAKFPGYREYVSNLASYFYTPFDEIDVDATNNLRSDYARQTSDLRDLQEDERTIAAQVDNVERYINTAEKVSNIGKYNRKKLEEE